MICNIPIGPYEKGPYKIKPFYYNFDYLDLKFNKRLPRKLKKKLKKLNRDENRSYNNKSR